MTKRLILGVMLVAAMLVAAPVAASDCANGGGKIAIAKGGNSICFSGSGGGGAP